LLTGRNFDEVVAAETGVDVSWPMHHYLDSKSWGGQAYSRFIEGCYKKFGKRSCDSTELARINMNFQQPATQHNYTILGFKKLVAPPLLFSLVKGFWDTNKHKESVELWPPGNTYTNNWKVPTYMVNVENRNLKAGGNGLKNQIWAAARPILENWVGHRLEETSLYGIRVYKEGSVLSPHCDRLPLVTSAIIHVDSDTDEPWPIEVIAHDGTAHNVTLKPGEMVLYESHTIIHGRPTPMKGRFYANLFVHFQPQDHSQMNQRDEIASKTGSGAIPAMNSRKAQVKRGLSSKKNKEAGHEQADAKDNEQIARMKELLDKMRNKGQDWSSDGEDQGHAHLHAHLNKVLHFSRGHDQHDLPESPHSATGQHAESGSGEPKARGHHAEENQDQDLGRDREVEPQVNEEVTDDALEENKDFLPLNAAAGMGDAKAVLSILSSFPASLDQRDSNGWAALHEAARIGSAEVADILIGHGASLDVLTNGGESPLWWAKRSHPAGHVVIKALQMHGAKEVGGL
jgi:hypothetical protein